jgi:hypothetical protein
MSDPVKEELERLEKALAGEVQQFKRAATGVVNQSEKLARTARGSRSSIPALQVVTKTSPPEPIARIGGNEQGEITRKFSALK